VTPRQSSLSALRAGIRASIGELGETVDRELAKSSNLTRAERANWATLHHESLLPDPDQPRKYFDREKLRVLAESIRSLGVREPLRVYSTGWGGKYRILDGQRRWHALEVLLAEGLEAFREVPVLIDEPPSDDTRLRVDQLVTSLHKEIFAPLETAASLLEVSESARGGAPLTAVGVAELFGFNAKFVERHLKVARGLTVEEREHLLHQYPRAPLDPLEKLVGWLSSPAAAGLDAVKRMRVIECFAEHRPAARRVEALLRPFAAKKRAGRRPRFSFRSGRTREGGFEVSFRIPPNHAAEESLLLRAEAELEKALIELRSFRSERVESSHSPAEGSS
jgi:ParB/RepB/Spo0J family partition protein